MSSIPLSDLSVTDTARRDQYGRYLIVPPSGGKPMGYTRVTTIAKALTMTAAWLLGRRP